MTTALLTVWLLVSSQTTCTYTPVRLPTLSGWGDSIMFGICSGGLPDIFRNQTPGWWTTNRAVSGETPSQIRTRYYAEESTSCYGGRCAVLWLEGGVNCLRGGISPETCISPMLEVVDDALAKGYIVVWSDVFPYACYNGVLAGVNHRAQAINYNSLMATACTLRASNPKLRCVTSFAQMEHSSLNGCLAAAYTCDGIHLTVAGAGVVVSRSSASLQAH